MNVEALIYAFMYIVVGIIVFAMLHIGNDYDNDNTIYANFWLAVAWPLTLAVGFTVYTGYILYKIPGFLADAILWLFGQGSNEQKQNKSNGNN